MTEATPGPAPNPDDPGLPEPARGRAVDRPVRADDVGQLPPPGDERAGDLRAVRAPAPARARLAAGRGARADARADPRASLRRAGARLPAVARLFADDFLDYLAAFRFSGDVDAMPEGTVCFANEPLLRVTAPRIEAQLLETLLLNQINFQTMIATKAARVVLAAGGGEPGAGERVVDFSPRRDHGIDAAMKVARSAAVAGCGGTSNVGRGDALRAAPRGDHGPLVRALVRRRGGRVSGVHRGLPRHAVLLVDTYDTLEGVRHAIAAVARRRAPAGRGAARLGRPAGALARRRGGCSTRRA